MQQNTANGDKAGNSVSQNAEVEVTNHGILNVDNENNLFSRDISIDDELSLSGDLHVHHNGTTIDNRTNADQSENLDMENNDHGTNTSDESSMVGECCKNCRRQQPLTLVSHRISFHVCKLRQIRQMSRLRHIKCCRTSTERVILCNECYEYLVNAERKKSSSYRYTWPSFYWSMISNPDAQRIYGSKLWQFIPSERRPWWLTPILEFECYNVVNLEYPPSIFMDRSIDLISFQEVVSSYKLSRLIDACNNFMIPNVLCLWGCTGNE